MGMNEASRRHQTLAGESRHLRPRRLREWTRGSAGPFDRDSSVRCPRFRLPERSGHALHDLAARLAGISVAELIERGSNPPAHF